MAQYSLTERQKTMLRSLVPGLEDRTVKTEWIYFVYRGPILGISGLYKAIWREHWQGKVTEADFDDFVDAGLFRRKGGNAGDDRNLTLNAQKIIEAVINNFGAEEDTVPRKIEAAFGEPSNDPDFRCDIFLVMPFRTELDNVHKVLKSLAGDLNLVLKRGDEFSSVQEIVINDVWSAINHCRLVIADCTALEKDVDGRTHKVVNGNVYYEIGIADALKKPVILITRDINDIEFDLRHRRFVTYEHAYKLYDSLKPYITKIIGNNV